jgi:beta-lactamase class A
MEFERHGRSYVVSSRLVKLIFLVLAVILGACTPKNDIPFDHRTPPPHANATPLQKLELKRDAELEKQFAEIAIDAKGKVGVAAVILETGEAALLNDEGHYPMQSVYKLPISMAIMDHVRSGKVDLDEKISVTTDDLVRPNQASPLRDKNPKGGEFTIRELIRLALVESDGTASDVLLRMAGGPEGVQSYLSQIGINDMKIVNSEKEFGNDWDAQYENWTTPAAAIELLRFVKTGTSASLDRRAETATPSPDEKQRETPLARKEGSLESNDHDVDLIFDFMADAVTGPKRIKGLLPIGTAVAHKTGTGGTRAGITSATNDIGIIYLPNGKHLAIAVFITDSPADGKTREGVIARIARAAFDRWQK